MKWVKCVYNDDNYFNDLTIGKIYEVLSVSSLVTNTTTIGPVIDIINDKGEPIAMYMQDSDCIWFEDADAEVRDNKINQIIK